MTAGINFFVPPIRKLPVLSKAKIEPYHPEYARNGVKADLERVEESLAQALSAWFSGLLANLVGDKVQKAEDLPEEPIPAGLVLARLDQEEWWKLENEILKKILLDETVKAAQKGKVTVDRQLKMNLSWSYMQPAVMEWAAQNAAQLVGLIAQDVKEKLRQYIVGGLSEQKTVFQIRDEISALQDDANQAVFSKDRAAMIANTEVIRAHAQGAQIGYKESGVVRGMKWLDGQVGACQKCADLNGDIKALGEPFYSDPHFGDGLPPRHPNCRCAIAPVTVDEAKKLDLPEDDRMINDVRNGISELTDIQTYAEINKITVQGKTRWHYIRRHFSSYEGRPPQINDLARAELLLEQILAGNSDGSKDHLSAVVYYKEWDQKNVLTAPVVNGKLVSLYLKEKRKFFKKDKIK